MKKMGGEIDEQMAYLPLLCLKILYKFVMDHRGESMQGKDTTRKAILFSCR